MKTYKIKSLIYFSCFLMASFLYYGMEQYDRFNEELVASQTPDVELEELQPSESLHDSKDLAQNP